VIFRTVSSTPEFLSAFERYSDVVAPAGGAVDITE
jgi:hypothetical protein